MINLNLQNVVRTRIGYFLYWLITFNNDQQMVIPDLRSEIEYPFKAEKNNVYFN